MADPGAGGGATGDLGKADGAGTFPGIGGELGAPGRGGKGVVTGFGLIPGAGGTGDNGDGGVIEKADDVLPDNGAGVEGKAPGAGVFTEGVPDTAGAGAEEGEEEGEGAGAGPAGTEPGDIGAEGLAGLAIGLEVIPADMGFPTGLAPPVLPAEFTGVGVFFAGGF